MNDRCVSRRRFIKTSAAVAAASTVPAIAADEKKKEQDAKSLVPTRRLGKTEVDVSMLSMGASGGATARQLNTAKEVGIRYLDTADCYGNGQHEKDLGEWLKTQKREEWFVVSKDHPKTPAQWIEMLDARLKNMQSDYIDLYFIHMLGDREYQGHGSETWPVDKEWQKAAERIKKSGKAKFVGFSTHARDIDARCALLETAAKKESWVEAIMVATNPNLVKENARFNKALDACYKANVGLISMKECKIGRSNDQVKKFLPKFEAMGLTPYAAILSAIWTDERFASICSAMDNVKKIRENAETAKNFKPFTKEQMSACLDLINAYDHTFCCACTGKCREAGNTTADLNSIARYLTYYEEMGEHAHARELFAALPKAERQLDGIDTRAAHRACTCHLDFSRIIKAAKEKLA